MELKDIKKEEQIEEVKVELGPYALKGIAGKLRVRPEDIALIRVGGSFLYIETRTGIIATLDYDTGY